MQKIIFLFVLIFNAFLLRSQSYPGAKLYAYSQTVARGKRPENHVGVDGTEITEKTKPQRNLWIYLIYPDKVPIYPSELYINGKRHKLNAEEVRESPVVHKRYVSPDETDTTVLVPQTIHKILMILPGSMVNFSPPAALKNLITSNEAVVGYTVKNKKYYTTIKKIKKLPSAAAM